MVRTNKGEVENAKTLCTKYTFLGVSFRANIKLAVLRTKNELMKV
jgi:hypothetical protein